MLASKQVGRGRDDEDDELTEEEFLRFHVLCVIFSVVLRFSRCLHPGVCNKRKKKNSIYIVLCSFDVSTWTKSTISGTLAIQKK